MSRGRQILLLLAGVALVVLVAYLAYQNRPQPRAIYPPGSEEGLAWLPADAAAIGAIDLEGIRKYPWFLRTLSSATEGVAEDADYRAFVTATGFDYTRDLERIWAAAFVANQRAQVAGVAEGRFASGTIIAYARTQGAAVSRYQNFETYEWRRAPIAGQPERRFAFAFLEESRLAFAADAALLNRVLDCWLGRAPSVGADESRRAELSRIAAGQHAWVVVDPSRWSPAAQGPAMGQSDFAKILAQASLGLRVTEQQAELQAEARCHETQPCQRLRDNIRVMALAGRLALSRDPSETSRAMGEALSNLSLDLRDATIEARLSLSPETLTALLRAAPSSVIAH